MPSRARRRPFRRRSVRAGWLEAVERRDPALAAELRELRRHNPQAYRKRILLLSRDWDLSAVAPPPEPDEE